MIIAGVTLRGFGKYRQVREFAFAPGLNIIIGPNESGKTTLMNSLKVAFFGQKRDLDRWASWDWQGESAIGLRYRLEDEAEYCLERVLPGGFVLSCDGSKLAGGATAHKKALLTHLGIGEEKLFDNTVYIGAGEAAVEWDATQTKSLRNHIEGLMTGGGEVTASAALAGLKREISRLGGPPTAKGRGGEIGELEQAQSEYSLKLASLKEQESVRAELAAHLRQVEDDQVKVARDLSALEPIAKAAGEQAELEAQLRLLNAEKETLAFRLEQIESTDKLLTESRARLESYRDLEALGQDVLARANSLAALADTEPQEAAAPLAPPSRTLYAVAVGLCAIGAVVAIWAGAFLVGIPLLVLALAVAFFGIAGRQGASEPTPVDNRAAVARSELSELLRSAGVDDIQALAAANDGLQAARRELSRAEGMLAGILGADTKDSLAKRYRDLLDEAYKRERRVSEIDENLPKNIDVMEAARAAHQLEALREQARALSEQQMRARAKLDALPLGSLTDLEEDIEHCGIELSERRASFAALSLAARELEAALMEAQREFVPEVAKAASAYMRELSAGAYDTVTLGEGLEAAVGRDGTSVSPANLSSGTFDQLYFALRVAIADALTSDARLPLFLDDAFVYFDEKRLAQAQKLITRLAGLRQVFLFTHDQRYASWDGQVTQLSL